MNKRRTSIAILGIIVVVGIVFFLFCSVAFFSSRKNNRRNDDVLVMSTYDSVKHTSAEKLYRMNSPLPTKGYKIERVGKNKYVTLSKFSNNKYECSGSCYCDEENRSFRRAVGTVATKPLMYTAIAVSTVLAYRMAREYFDMECLSRFGDSCESGKVSSDVEFCESDGRMEASKFRIEDWVDEEEIERDWHVEPDGSIVFDEANTEMGFYECKGKCRYRRKNSKYHVHQLEFDENEEVIGRESFLTKGNDRIYIQSLRCKRYKLTYRDNVIATETLADEATSKADFVEILNDFCALHMVAGTEEHGRVQPCWGDIDTIECRPKGAFGGLDVEEEGDVGDVGDEAPDATPDTAPTAEPTEVPLEETAAEETAAEETAEPEPTPTE